MTTQITTLEQQKQEMDFYKNLASTALKSGNYSGMSEMTALNIMLSAKDLGVSPMKALNGGFYIVNGKISMSTALMCDRIRKEGHSIKIPEWTDQKCVIIGVRKDNGDSVKVEFTMDDANRAGLLSSATWKKYPKNMLYNRAMSMLARVLFPDVVGNCYSEDEKEEISNSKPFERSQQVEEICFESPSVEEAVVEVSKEEELEDLARKICQSLDLEESPEILDYLYFCESKITKPLREVVPMWLDKPDTFLEAYNKWIAKRSFKK